MNQGVEILLARMDSNPDEFVGMDWPNKSRWDWLLDDLRRRNVPTREDKEREYVPLRFLSDEEVRMLWDKLESLRADQFTKQVMETLLRDEETNHFEDAMRAGIGKLPAFGEAPVKAEGAAIRYSGFGSKIEIPYTPIKKKGKKK